MNNWIDVNDRLPEYGEYVIVQNSNYIVFMATYFRKVVDSEGVRHEWADHETKKIRSNIVYWQPLPETKQILKKTYCK